MTAPIKAEKMYVERDLFQVPSYDFEGIWWKDGYKILRTFIDHDPHRHMEVEWGVNKQKFEEVNLQITPYPSSNIQILSSPPEVAENLFENRKLVGRTELSIADGLKVIIEYPVKTINVTENPNRFQVDTGPIVFPDIAKNAEKLTLDFQIAYIAFNDFENAEFLIRKVTNLPAGKPDRAQIMHYSQALRVEAKNTIYSVRD